jgi:hypothetical protein
MKNIINNIVINLGIVFMILLIMFTSVDIFSFTFPSKIFFIFLGINIILLITYFLTKDKNE